MASVMTNLDAVVQEYLQDTEFQQSRQEVAENGPPQEICVVAHGGSISQNIAQELYDAIIGPRRNRGFCVGWWSVWNQSKDG